MLFFCGRCSKSRSFALTGLVNFISLTQGGARFHVACPGLFSFARSGLQFDLFSFPLGQGTALSFVQEQFPFRDAVGVAEERRHRQFLTPIRR